MGGHCSTGQSPQWAVVPMEEEEYVFVAFSFPARKAHVPYYIAVCGLHGSTKFFHIIS